MLKTGDIVSVKNLYGNDNDFKDKTLLIIDSTGQDLLCAFITTNKKYNGLSFTNNDLEEGILKEESIVRVENLYSIPEKMCIKIASVKKGFLDKVLRGFTKYAANVYFKNFHSNKTLNKISASGKIVDENRSKTISFNSNAFTQGIMI